MEQENKLEERLEVLEVLEVTKEEHKKLKTKEHCPYYLSSTTQEGLYTNPDLCKNCNGLDEHCLIYQNIKKYKELL